MNTDRLHTISLTDSTKRRLVDVTAGPDVHATLRDFARGYASAFGGSIEEDGDTVRVLNADGMTCARLVIEPADGDSDAQDGRPVERIGENYGGDSVGVRRRATETGSDVWDVIEYDVDDTGQFIHYLILDRCKTRQAAHKAAHRFLTR